MRVVLSRMCIGSVIFILSITLNIGLSFRILSLPNPNSLFGSIRIMRLRTPIADRPISNGVERLCSVHAFTEQSNERDRIDRALKELYDWFGYETYGADGYCTTDEENE